MAAQWAQSYSNTARIVPLRYFQVMNFHAFRNIQVPAPGIPVDGNTLLFVRKAVRLKGTQLGFTISSAQEASLIHHIKKAIYGSVEEMWSNLEVQEKSRYLDVINAKFNQRAENGAVYVAGTIADPSNLILNLRTVALQMKVTDVQNAMDALLQSFKARDDSLRGFTVGIERLQVLSHTDNTFKLMVVASVER